MRFLLLLVVLFVALPALAQEPPPEAVGEKPTTAHIETPPELIGGMAGLTRRVVYPDAAIQAGVQGKVFVQFVVDEEGMLTEPVCVRSPSDLLCEAAIAAVMGSRFEPGTQRGEAVKVRFTLPVDFRLADEAPSPVQTSPPPEASGGGEEREMTPEEAADLAKGIYWVVDQNPVLVDGLANLQRRVRYPRSARRAGTQGKVFVQFIVTEQGRVQDPTCFRSPDEQLCAASIEAVENAIFEPGYVDGAPVKMRMTLPIDFKLR